MGTRQELIEEYKQMGFDPEDIDEEMTLDDIRGLIFQKENLKQEELKEPDWRDRLSPEDSKFVTQLEGWGYREDTIKDIIAVGFDQEEYHEDMNLIIKQNNEAKLRHGLDHLVEPLLPTREVILDLYSNGILDDWLNLSDEVNPNNKPNKRFEHFVTDKNNRIPKERWF
ncbi:hypothetical protein ACFL1Z_01635 [Thermodesulfobacteriota bacterium]